MHSRTTYTIKYVFTQALCHEQNVTRSIFKQSTAGLNSEFSFCKTGWLNKAQELGLPLKEKKQIYTFPKDVSAK